MLRPRLTLPPHVRLEKQTRPPFTSPLAYINREELSFLYKEIVEDQCYSPRSSSSSSSWHGHGLAMALKEGDVVVDVGANIGLYSLLASQSVGPSGRIVAIEASPTICEALRANLSSCPCESEVVNKAISSSNKEAVFTYYPRATGWSTLDPDDEEVRLNMRGFLDQEMLREGKGGASSPLLGVARMLFAFLGTGALYQWARDQAIEFMLGGKVTEKVRCETLEAICEVLSLSRIDMLKIDCERSEMDVLKGIGASQWRNIGSIAMEVHDDSHPDEGGKTSLERIEDLLTSHGFIVDVSQALEGTNLFMIFASSRGASSCS